MPLYAIEPQVHIHINRVYRTKFGYKTVLSMKDYDAL